MILGLLDHSLHYTKQMRNSVCTSKFNFKPPEAISHRVLANMSQFPRP